MASQLVCSKRRYPNSRLRFSFNKAVLSTFSLMNPTSFLLMTFRYTHCLWYSTKWVECQLHLDGVTSFQTTLTTWSVGRYKQQYWEDCILKRKTNVFFSKCPQKILKCKCWNLRSNRQSLHVSKCYLEIFESISTLRSPNLTSVQNIERFGREQ